MVFGSGVRRDELLVSLLLRRRTGLCWTRSPVVTISSPIEDREDDEG